MAAARPGTTTETTLADSTATTAQADTRPAPTGRRAADRAGTKRHAARAWTTLTAIRLAASFVAAPAWTSLAAAGRTWAWRRAALASLLLAAAVLILAPGAALAAGGGNHFYAGYCTWEAAELAHQTWGTWVPWFGDAGDWAPQAAASGWQVSPTPRVNSIAAMPRGVQGSGRDGHVGWVVDVDPDGAGVTLQSMNWSGRGVVSQHHVAVDGLVQFITPPGETAD